MWDECRGTEHQRRWEGDSSTMEIKSPSPAVPEDNSVQEATPFSATASASVGGNPVCNSGRALTLMTSSTSDGSSTNASKRQGGKQKSASNGSASSHGSSGGGGGGRRGGERLASSSSSSGGNSEDDDDDDGDHRRRRRPGDLYCKPQSRVLLPCDDDDDEITDSADEGGEENVEQLPPQPKQMATEMFTPPDSFQSVPSVYEPSSSSGRPILKPLSPTSLSVGYGAELAAANRVPDEGDRERTPTLDSPHPSEDQASSGGLLSPEITILPQVRFLECRHNRSCAFWRHCHFGHCCFHLACDLSMLVAECVRLTRGGRTKLIFLFLLLFLPLLSYCNGIGCYSPRLLLDPYSINMTDHCLDCWLLWSSKFLCGVAVFSSCA